MGHGRGVVPAAQDVGHVHRRQLIRRSDDSLRGPRRRCVALTASPLAGALEPRPERGRVRVVECRFRGLSLELFAALDHLRAGTDDCGSIPTGELNRLTPQVRGYVTDLLDRDREPVVVEAVHGTIQGDRQTVERVAEPRGPTVLTWF